MKLEVGKFYKIVIDVNGRVLTFSGEILSNDNVFVSFKDKYNKILNYNLRTIISFEEIDGGFDG